MTEPEKTEITIPYAVAAMLVAEAVERLWGQWANDKEGCCTRGCCAACAALYQLRATGQLDELYGWFVERCDGPHAAWDSDRGQVDRVWLDRVWSAPMGHKHSRTSEP